jgi:hypothetical protein
MTNSWGCGLWTALRSSRFSFWRGSWQRRWPRSPPQASFLLQPTKPRGPLERKWSGTRRKPSSQYTIRACSLLPPEPLERGLVCCLPSPNSNQSDNRQNKNTSDGRGDRKPIGCHDCLPSGCLKMLKLVGSTRTMKWLTPCDRTAFSIKGG